LSFEDKNVMKFRLMVAAALGVVVLPNLAGAVDVHTGVTEQELNAQMVVRCQYQMGEFGNSGMHACIRSEREARVALADYPDELGDIVGRCYRLMRMAGWDSVKLCSDRDVSAQAALVLYSTEYTDIVAMCQENVGEFGHDQVKQCADKQIAKQTESSD
jgi:hypothetical protein